MLNNSFDWTVECWNIIVVPGRGDDSPTIRRTRAFDILSQTEWGYITELREPFASDILEDVYSDFKTVDTPCMLYIRHSGNIWTRERFPSWDDAITYSENHQLDHFEIYSIDPVMYPE